MYRDTLLCCIAVCFESVKLHRNIKLMRAPRSSTSPNAPGARGPTILRTASWCPLRRMVLTPMPMLGSYDGAIKLTSYTRVDLVVL